MVRSIFLLCMGMSLWGASLYDLGRQAYDAGQLTEAFEWFKASAQQESAYYLGKMYGKGIGTPLDQNASAYWYRQAAQRYHGIAQKRFDYELDKERRRFVKTLDLNDTETEASIEQIVNAAFGLKAYQANYFLPASCGDVVYPSYTPSDQYSNCEAEMQLSFKYDIYDDLFGFNEIYTVAYTQNSFWQIYAESKPFRETNYNPEFIVSVLRDDKFGPVSLKGVSVSLSHQSNGQGNIAELNLVDANASTFPELDKHPEWGENRSRSWNYISASMMVQYSSLFAKLTGWWRFPESRKEDDNPELTDYIGHGSLQLFYPRGNSLTRMELHHNLQTGYGSVELDWTYPMGERISTYWYVKVFSGYGSSLIDYDQYVNKVAIGLSFSR